MPDLSHLWQRFLLASSLLVGLFIGAAVTVFGYSNLGNVNVRWSVLHIDGIPLWTVAIVPIALTVIAGTLYHWINSFHHFTEHMRHRHRVHELEAEVASLRAHLDPVLELPAQSTSRLPVKHTVTPPPPEKGAAALASTVMAALPEPAKVDAAAANGATRAVHRRTRNRASLAVSSEPVASEVVAPTNAAATPVAAGKDVAVRAPATTKPEA